MAFSPIGLRGMGHSQSLRHETRLALGSSGAVLEAPAFVASLDDVAVMREAVEKRGRHLGVAEHRRPFGEGEIGGDDDRRPLVEPAYQVEQQLAARLGERQIAEFVERHQINAGQLLGQPAGDAGASLGLQTVDQVDDIEEARPSAALAYAIGGDGDRQMAFAGAGRDSDMAPGFWRAKRRSTIPFIRWPAERWLRAAGGSCTAALCI